MATIWRPDQPLARCSVCGVARQFHFASDVPRSADRDHEFVAETIDDFEPGDLTPEQLVYAIAGASGRSAHLTNSEPVSDEAWDEASRLDARVAACREELKARVRTVFGVTWDDLLGAVE
jgi:hypothetical protein